MQCSCAELISSGQGAIAECIAPAYFVNLAEYVALFRTRNCRYFARLSSVAQALATSRSGSEPGNVVQPALVMMSPRSHMRPLSGEVDECGAR